ncbi:hypothetical protein [Dokdonella sp.]|uniref:hypothetical protein n=1 Tax=Dokdonella sp. TaxID=2291710 RepID=UPI00378403FE
MESTPEGIPGTGGTLGYSVALHGEVAAVGAPGQSATSVNLYRHVGPVWQQEAVLHPAGATNGMGFGGSVALGEDIVVATGGDSIYTFIRAGSAWQQVDSFTGTGPVSLSGQRLAIGNGTVYVRNGAGWTQESQLQADAGEIFATTVLDGDFALAWSSAFDSTFQIRNYAYLFNHGATGWVREARIDLGMTGAFSPPVASFALSGQTALVAWNGVVTPYVRAGDGSWSAQNVFDPLTAAPGFGARVAIDGDRALASSPDDRVYGWSGAGTTYVFERVGGVWSRVAHVAHTPVNNYDYSFGRAVALAGDTMVIGAPGAYTMAGATGDATVFSKIGGDWSQVAVLDAGNEHRDEQFGAAAAASVDTVLIGAPTAATDHPLATGVAYVFEAGNSGWLEQARLLPSAPASLFGSSVALDQDTAVIGASHEVYVFTRGNGSWPQQARLTSDVTGQPVAFGAAVAVRGDLLAVGEPGLRQAHIQGRVHLFTRSGTTWSPLVVLQAADGAVDDGFGSSLALSGNTLVIGAPNADIGIETGGGAVYVFDDGGGAWAQHAKITAPVPAKLAGFGHSVAFEGDAIVVGAVGANRGAAYVYSWLGGAATLRSSLIPANPDAVSTSYGSAVAISQAGDRIVVGQRDSAGPNANGRAFVFAISGSDWLPNVELSGEAPPTQPGLEGDGFGSAVTMAGETAVIGAPGDGRGGAAYFTGVGDTVFEDGFEAH